MSWSAEHQSFVTLQVMLDKDDKVIRPAKLWCDTESAQEAEELSTAFDFQIPAGFTGKSPEEWLSCQIMDIKRLCNADRTGPKLLWVQRHEPESFAAMATMFLPASYMTFVLTGEKVCDA